MAQTSTTAAPIPTEKLTLGTVVVIGGCGFLGQHIVSLLHKSYNAKIHVLDLTTRNRHSSPEISYHEADITSVSSLVSIFDSIKPDVVIHTASPTAVGSIDPAAISRTHAIYYKVNVEGTRCVIEACQKTGVKALVYTSSASVINDTIHPTINADERWPVIPPHLQMEYYTTTKAEAEELVLKANRAAEAPKLLTVSIRPSGIFGPGDLQQTPRILAVLENKKTGFQLGDNTNLFDFTHVTNVAHAHLLAANALLATSRMSVEPLSHERVDGEAFFITNCSPVPFWDYARALWAAGGSDKDTEHVWVIGKDLGLAISTLVDWIGKLIGRRLEPTRQMVNYSCMTRYFNPSKAKTRLGYRPLVPLLDGIKDSVDAFYAAKLAESQKKGQ